jgi:predicted transposase YbfD/YdcC
MKIKQLFSQLPDPRSPQGKRHLLEDILLLTLLAVLCGAESWEAIEIFGKSKRKLMRTVLKLPHGIPSHDAIERVFQRMDSDCFEQAFIDFTKHLQITTEGKIVSIDGKTLRGSHDAVHDRYALHMISAWCHANQMTLGQLRTEAKVNEIEAVKKLITMLDIKGSVVTIDAMGCQKEIAAQLIGKQADYILAVKANQENLLEEVVSLFNTVTPAFTHQSIDKDHGRIEQRTCHIIEGADWIDEHELWKGLHTFIKIEASREIGDQRTSEIRYYISSLYQSAAYFNHAIRTHWGIENSYHWVLDVQFNEDHSRKRKGQSAENFAIIRRTALNLIKKKTLRRMGVQNKRLYAGWNDDFLLSLLNM